MSNKNMVPEAEFLDPDECWKLLAEAKVGRLAVLANGHPDVFPVNFTVDGPSLVFRTGAGTKQQSIAADSMVALEADALSAEFGLAWSVVVKGRAKETLSTGDELNQIRRGLFPWQGVGQEHLIRITAGSVTGRRFNLTAPMAWHTSLDDVTRAGFE